MALFAFVLWTFRAYMSVTNKIIINADDFGYSTTVNRAIIKSFQRCLITSTSLMANMPGFEDAVRLIQNHPYLPGRVGLHLNLTEGYPLSGPIRACKRFCHPAGHFIYKRQESLFYLNTRERDAVYEELEAQLEKVLAAGILPSHLDSHHHIHTEWAIVKLVARLGRTHGIRKMRLTRNMGQQRSGPKRVYKELLNRWYLKGLSGLRAVDYFGDIHDWKFLQDTHPPSGKNIEIMVHPLFDEKGELVDYDQRNLQAQLAPVIDHRYTISYTDL